MTDGRKPSRARPRIAVVNDDTAFLRLMQELLEHVEGYEVLTCRQWDDVYAFVKEQQPDLLILDLIFGGEERGWTILELLTLDPQTRPIPVLVCSAALRSLQEHASVLQRYGVEVLPKPFDLETLLEKIEATLRKGRR